MYGRLWRWHFFAALIVIPFVLWQSITGVLYLWHRELAALTHPELTHVAPAAEVVSYQRQLDAVLEHQPRARLDTIEITDDPARSTAFLFVDDSGLTYPAFVDPHTGTYLGHIEPTHWIRGLSRALHGGWPINPFGSYLLELGASWAIVMTLTGLYLWWPRTTNGLAGVLYPRLRRGSRVFWRDLHATVGVYFAVIILAFLFTALPWTTFWGGKVLAPIESSLGQASPRAFFFAGDTSHTHTPPNAADRSAQAVHHALSLDELVAAVRAEGASGRIDIHPRGATVNARDPHARSWDETWLQLDAHSGAVMTKVVWDDYPLISRFVALGVDFHEGRFFGTANQIFNTLVAVALIWLSVTGFMGWYRRRPRGGLSAPPKRELRYPRAVVATATVLCVVLPLLGASVLAIELIDRMLGRFLPKAA